MNRALIKSVVRMLSDVGVYAAIFEGPFLANSNAFYQAEGRRFVNELEVCSHPTHAHLRTRTYSCTHAHMNTCTFTHAHAHNISTPLIHAYSTC